MKIKNKDDYNIFLNFKIGERLEICRSCEFNSKIYYGEQIGQIKFKKNHLAPENLNPVEHCIKCNCILIFENDGKIFDVHEKCPLNKWGEILKKNEVEELNIIINSNNKKKCNTCKK
jgi:hypothetical protein